ncbi:GTPase HflX, partial [Acholeplasma laidlawii]|nr:GTPase HflX [Acholeplasma laidlawii]
MQKLDRAILVALNYQGNYESCKLSLDELEELAKAVQIKTVDKVIQSNDKIEPKFFIGSGKVLEIKQMIDILNVDMVIFDDTLSPAQIRNLEEALDVQIFDR